MKIIVLIQISIASILISNFIFTRFIGLCPFFGISKKMSSAVGMGMAVIFVMTLSSFLCWIVDATILTNRDFIHAFIPGVPPEYDLTFMRTIVFILIIAALVQFVEMVLQKYSPILYTAMGIYLPLITTNCAVLAVVIINTQINEFTGENYTFIESIVSGMMSGVGFTLALILMASIREKLDLADIPRYLRGLPVAFITAGLMAIAFMGFCGLNFFSGTGGQP